jgi:hypothetical protein
MKKPTVVALVLLLLIPVVLVLGGVLFSLIDPEIAAGHANYVRNFHLLSQLKVGVIWATAAVVILLWLLVCLQVIRSKKRSMAWLLLAALGPFGLAVLAMLGDRTTAETDPYSRFVRNLNVFVRAGYEAGTFVIAWVGAYEVMVLKRMLMIRYEAIATGSSVAQVMDRHNASGGMWAFSEGLEVMFLVVLLYLLRPIVFNVVNRVMAIRTSPKVQ